MIRIAALIALFTPAIAQADEVTTYGPLLEKCYDEAVSAEAKSQCVGALSDECMNEEEGGHSTLGMTSCTLAEARVWDGFLNSEYAATMGFFQDWDEGESTHFPEYAKRQENLRDAQRAWIAYRDAECGLANAIWGSGSMRHIAGSTCMLNMTARRTIELFEMREEF